MVECYIGYIFYLGNYNGYNRNYYNTFKEVRTMKVYFNEEKLCKLLNEITCSEVLDHWRLNYKDFDSVIYLYYSDDERIRVNVHVSYNIEDRFISIDIKSTGLLLGTNIPEGSIAEVVVLNYLKKNSNRIFKDVTSWRRQ